MPDGSSSEAVMASLGAMPGRTLSPRAAVLAGSRRAIGVGTTMLMIALGFVPLLHAAGFIVLLLLPLMRVTPGWVAALAPLELYVLPAAVVHLASRMRPLRATHVAVGSADFFVWWFAAQCQVVFARLPMLDELLRLVPGLYSMWLRLWGSRIGGLVYWSPGARVVDRQLLVVGRRAVIGMGAQLVPHYLGYAPRDAGSSDPTDKPLQLVVAPITIGAGAIVGGYCIVGPGARIADGVATAPTRPVRPFAQRDSTDRTA